MSANTSTEGKENKELKITKTDDAEKLIDKYFEDFIENSDKSTDAKENTRYVLSTHALTFTTKDQNVKSQLGDDESEKTENFVQAINVLESGKRDFVLAEIAKGAGLNIKSAPKEKVSKKVEQIKKENAEKKAREEKEADSREL